MTSPSPLAALMGGSSTAPTTDQPSDTDALGDQLQQLQVQAMMIARSNPALAEAMRQIIQIASAAGNTAASSTQPSGGGASMSPGPETAGY